MEANSAYECLNRTPKRHAWMGQMTDVDDEACYSDWDKLPQELAERVLACLPVASVFQCRSVCKKWMSILTSSSFLDLWAKVSPQVSWFLVYNNSHGFAAFSPATNRWNNIPIFARCSLDPRQVLLMASSGGLLCFRSRNTEFTTLTVCNPVTKTFRVLPDMLQIRYIDILGMVADRNSNSYKILVTGTTESSVGYSITELYDSSTESWVHHCHSERDCLQFWYEVHAIWCEGFFYCLTMMPISSTQGYRLLAYDMQQKDWFDLSVKIPSNNLRCPSLLACQGRLLLTGKIVVENTIKSVCIWELDRISLKWKEIDSMPAFILNKIHVPHFLVIQCFGNSDLICFSRYRGSQSVMYDLSRKTWHWIPDNNVCKERKAQDTTALDRNNLVGMSFEPSLASKV
eukprot:c29092_g1_i3 orf=2647-3849(+)